MFTHSISRAARTIAAALLATLLVACGGINETAPAQGPPTISSFAATPAAQPFGGGQVVLSWNAPDASTLVIDNGVGDVSGLSSKAVNVASGTTFMLTASNAAGMSTATTAVTVALQAVPTIASFTAAPGSLPAGGGSATLSWATADATSLSIDNGVGVVTGTSKIVNVTANTTFQLTATNPAGAVTQTIGVTVAVASANTRFIDVVNGADTNPCTQAAPCKTLVNTMLGAPSGANTFLLADGVYSSDTEGVGGINIPHGATLQAMHPGAATLATLAVNVVGSATLNGLVFDRKGPAFGCGGVEAASSFGIQTLTLTGVFSNCTNWLSIGGNVKATMTPGALPGGVYTTGLPANATQWALVNGAGELLIQGGVLDGNNTGNAYPSAGLLEVLGNGKLTLDAVTVRNWPQAVLHTQGGTTALRNGTLIDNVGATTGFSCSTGGAILIGAGAGSLTMDHATLSNAAGAGICVLNNFDAANIQRIQLIQSTITKSAGAAIQSESVQGIGAIVTADGLSLTNNGYGIFWAGRAGTSFDLLNTTITGSSIAGGTGVFMNLPSGSFKLRGSTVSGNAQYGMELDGSMTADLGKAGDPGANTFTGNGLAGLRSVATAGQFVDAVGNTWIPGQQGADANGRYSVPPSFTPVPKTGPAGGVNFKIDSASTLNL